MISWFCSKYFVWDNRTRHISQKKQRQTCVTLLCNANTIFFFKLDYLYNLGQKDVAKLTKLSKIEFSMECFTADFFARFCQKRQALAFEGSASACHQIQAFGLQTYKSTNVFSKIVWIFCISFLLLWECIETPKMISF